MKRFTDRMSFFTKNLLFSMFNIIVIGTVLIVSSYYLQKNIITTQLHNQVKTITATWAGQLDAKQVELTLKEKNYEGPAQTEIRKQLDLMSKYNASVAQAYIFGTELQDGNKTSIIAMPTHVVEQFKEAKLQAGDMYEQPAVVVETLGRMLASDTPTLSEFYSDDYGIWTTIAYPIKDSSGKTFAYFAVDSDAKAIPEGLSKLLKFGISLLAICLVVILTAQYFIVRQTLSPIRWLIRGIEEVSAGNLDVTIQTGGGDLGLVNEKFNAMVDKINGTILSIQEASASLTESAISLNNTSERNNQQAEEIHASIKSIASSIEQQEQSSAESSRAMAEMADVVQTIAHNSANVSDEASGVEQISVKGNTVVQNMTGQMGQINEFVTNMSNTVSELDRRSQEIGSILTLITGIANQTNMLALNAAIEASRVGEHGKGFAVVAGEVRKLAEQSQYSAKQISTLVGEIQSEIGQTAQAMETGRRVVHAGMTISGETGLLFNDILHATKKVSLQMQEVSTAAQQMSAGTEEISATSEELSDTVKTTAQSANNIARSVDEQQQLMEAIVTSSVQLTATAQELMALTAQFRVRKPS